MPETILLTQHERNLCFNDYTISVHRNFYADIFFIFILDLRCF